MFPPPRASCPSGIRGGVATGNCLSFFPFPCSSIVPAHFFLLFRPRLLSHDDDIASADEGGTTQSKKCAGTIMRNMKNLWNNFS